jgi:hypothetical protein
MKQKTEEQIEMTETAPLRIREIGFMGIEQEQNTTLTPGDKADIRVNEFVVEVEFDGGARVSVKKIGWNGVKECVLMDVESGEQTAVRGDTRVVEVECDPAVQNDDRVMWINSFWHFRDVGADELREMYYEDELTVDEIKGELDVEDNTASQLIRRAGICV